MSSGWPIVSLGELVNLQRRPVETLPEAQYQEIGIYCFGRGIFHKIPRSGLEVGDKKLFHLKEGDLILQVTFAWEGAIALCSKHEEGLYGSTRYPTFRVNEDRCFAPFLTQYLLTRDGQEQISRICPGSAGRNRVLSIKRVPEVMVPLPPLEEQRRIMARVDSLSAKIAEAKLLKRETIKEVEILMRAGASYAVDFLPPMGTLGQVLSGKPRNGWSPKCDGQDAGISVLTLSAVTGFHYNPRAFKRTAEPTDPKGHYWLKAGDLLVTRSNTLDLVGHAAIYDGTPSPCIYPDLTMRVQVDETKADARFVHIWLQTTAARDHIARCAKGTSPTMKKISQGVVTSIPFPVQASVDLQRRIVDYVEGLQSKTRALHSILLRTSKEIDALRPSIIDRAFKGDLR